MPVLTGGNLSSVETSFKPYPEGLYTIRVEGSELAKDNAQLRIKSVIEAPEEFAGKSFTHFISLNKKDGTRNAYGWADIKRYLEAVFGKGSAEAEAGDPDTDALNGSVLKLYLVEGEYEGKPTQEVKKILPA